MKNSTDTIRYWAHKLLACRTEPQTTVLPHDPTWQGSHTILTALISSISSTSYRDDYSSNSHRYNKTAVHRFYQAFFTFKCYTVSRCTCTCNSIYAHKKSVAFPVAISMKLTNSQWHYIQISDTKFWSNKTINVEKYGNSFTPLSKVWFSLHWISQNSIDNFL